MRMVVDLPAPLGPRKPKKLPRGTSRSTPSTAALRAYDLRRPRTRMAGDILQFYLSDFEGPEREREIAGIAGRHEAAGRLHDDAHFGFAGGCGGERETEFEGSFAGADFGGRQRDSIHGDVNGERC